MIAARRASGLPLAEAACALLLLGVFIVVSMRLALQGADDDQYFLRALDERGLFEFLGWRYREWTGRVAIEGLLVATIGVAALWKTIIPVAFIGTALCIWQLALSRRMPMLSGTLAVVAMLLLVNRMVLYEAAFWVTGFFNYLLPCFLGLLAIALLSKPGLRKPLAAAVAMPAMAIACQAEQVAFALLTVLAARMVFRRCSRQPIGGEIAAMVVGAASASASLLAPGNTLRQMAELKWLPEFADMGLATKLILGLDRLNVHTQSPGNILIVLVAGLSAWVTLRTCRTATARIAAVVLWLFVASAFATILVRVAGLEGLPRFTGVVAHLSPGEWSRGGIFVSMGFTIAVYGALATSAACRARDPATLLAGAGIPLLAVMSTMLVSLSPTIYASGFRILFVGDLLLVVHGAMLVSDILERRSARQQPARSHPAPDPSEV